MPSLKNLFPEQRVAWIIWLLLVAIGFPLYYIRVFPEIYREQERFWDDSERGRSSQIASGKIDNSEEKRDFQWRVPYHISDFVEVPLYIKVRNISAEDIPETVVSVLPTESTIDFIASVNGVRKNSVTLESIPPGGEQVAKIMLRSLKKGNYSVELQSGNQSVNSYNPSIEFDRGEVLRWWVRKHLLSPPGANILLPITLLLWVGLGEAAYNWGRTFVFPKQTNIWQSIVDKLLSPIGVIVFLIGALLHISKRMELSRYSNNLLIISVVFVFTGALMGWWKQWNKRRAWKSLPLFRERLRK
jgi:hypothetical protein